MPLSREYPRFGGWQAEAEHVEEIKPIQLNIQWQIVTCLMDGNLITTIGRVLQVWEKLVSIAPGRVLEILEQEGYITDWELYTII